MSRHLRDLLKLLEQATYEDSYGVYGSEFVACRICERDSAGRKPQWHAPGCPVPRLLSKYEGKGQRPRGVAS